MATELEKKPQTFGRFDIVGNITIDDKTFQLSEKGKNNPNWIMNVFNPKVEGKDGQSMFIRIQGGYDSNNGKTIYTTSKQDSNLEIAFGDRQNPNILEMVNEKSFIKVGYKKEKIKDENGKEYTGWVYEKFLDSFDAINFLHKVMPLASEQKVHIKGALKFSEYNGSITKNFELQSIWILTNNEELGKEMPCEFKFIQDVLLDSNSVDKSKIEEGKAILHIKLYVKEKKEYKVLPLDMVIPVDENDKELKEKIIQKFFTVNEGKVRRIKLEGIFRSGLIQGNVTKEDLNEEVLEMISLGFYTEEEVLNVNANKEWVDDLVIIRPVIKKQDNGKILIDMDDDTYTLDDLKGKEVELIQEVEVEDDVVDDDLMNELENL